MANYADSVFNTEVTASSVRLPWNNTIFPGNYVAHLNAYRDQNVQAFPGVNFFRTVGAYVVPAESATVAQATYDLEILSPDLRQDDKPRKDRPFVIPKGAVVYRTAVSAPGVREETIGDGVTIAPKGITSPAAAPATALADGFFEPVGEFSAFVSILDGTGLGADTPVQVTTTGSLVARQNPSAGACRNSPSAILVEVCYFLPDAAPDADDVHIPYGVEAGQGY